MTAVAWDPQPTQDQFDLELALTEDWLSRRGSRDRHTRLGAFNDWARRFGLNGPQDLDEAAWLHFWGWLEEEQYGHAYRKHVMMEVREWLTWAAAEGLCEPFHVGYPIPQPALVLLCRGHQSNTFEPVRGFAYLRRGLLLGLVFGVGIPADDVVRLKVSDYDLRRHTLKGQRMDPRAEVLMQRYLSRRMGLKVNRPELIVNPDGSTIGRKEAHHQLNKWLRKVGGMPPVDRWRNTYKWMPTPGRDRDLVLDILVAPTLNVRRKPGRPAARAFDVGLVLRRMVTSLPEDWD